MPVTVTRMNPKTLPDAPKVGYSQISITEPGRLAFVSGQVAWPTDDTPTSQTLDGQTKQVVANLKSALDALEVTPHSIVQMRIYMTELNDETLNVAMGRVIRFLDGAQPRLTGLGVAALAAADLQIEIEMVVQLSV